MKRLALLASVLLASSAPLPAHAAAADMLRVIPVDVEGGAATLYVTPQGHSLLIDTGFPAGMGGPRPVAGEAAPPPSASSAERIVAVARAAGLSKIDYLLLTHYHLDHVGGVQDLLGLFPVGTFIDHGPNRENAPPTATPAQRAFSPETLYPRYTTAIAGHPHRVMRPGETLEIDDLIVTAVDSDREIPAKPLAGKGAPGVGCALQPIPHDTNLGGEENPRSLGTVASWGKARILVLGDTTWDLENQLVCPRDLIGPVDMMIADNHGTSNSGNPNLLNTVKPTIFVFNNGPRKGADEAMLATIAAAPFVKGMWQLHFATRSPDKNAPADQIANIEGPDMTHPLEIAIEKNGMIAVTNPRTGATKTYPQSPRR